MSSIPDSFPTPWEIPNRSRATWNDPASIRDACRRIEHECPGWRVWPDTTAEDGPYCAAPAGRDVGTLYAADPYTMCGLIKHVEVGT